MGQLHERVENLHLGPLVKHPAVEAMELVQLLVAVDGYPLVGCSSCSVFCFLRSVLYFGCLVWGFGGGGNDDDLLESPA